MHLWDRKDIACAKLLFNVMKVKSLSHVRIFATPWTVAHQGPRSMGFSRQEWVAISFSGESSQPRDGTQVPHITGRFFTV